MLVPFIAWIVSNFDWQYGVIPGVTGAGVCLLLFAFFAKNWPSDLGLMPYRAETNPKIAKTGQGENPLKKSFSVLFNCSKHPGFESFLQLFLYVTLHLMDWFLSILFHSAQIIILGL